MELFSFDKITVAEDRDGGGFANVHLYIAPSGCGNLNDKTQAQILLSREEAKIIIEGLSRAFSLGYKEDKYEF